MGCRKFVFLGFFGNCGTINKVLLKWDAFLDLKPFWVHFCAVLCSLTMTHLPGRPLVFWLLLLGVFWDFLHRVAPSSLEVKSFYLLLVGF